MFADYDDLKVISNDLTARKGMSLISIVRNEMYMLPAFLAHYRALGIERFVILDDRSDDGTLEYLADQPDVMVVGSEARYGEIVPPSGRVPLPDMRSNIIWRNVLMWKYGADRWTLMLDADEFLALPANMTVQDLAARASRQQDRRAILGVMLDLYPEHINNLRVGGQFDPSANWYFDGQQHFLLRKDNAPVVLYHGARARLLAQYGLKKTSLRLKLRNLVKPPRYSGVQLNSKYVMHRWGESDLFLNAHKTTASRNDTMLLPVRHYKFTSDLFRKVEMALAERRYAGGSVDYQSVSSLLERMNARDGTFLYRLSRDASTFDAFADTGNAFL